MCFLFTRQILLSELRVKDNKSSFTFCNKFYNAILLATSSLWSNIQIVKTYILKHNISNLISLITDLNLLSSLYILPKYMTNATHRNTTYKLKPKIILTCLLYF